MSEDKKYTAWPEILSCLAILIFHVAIRITYPSDNYPWALILVGIPCVLVLLASVIYSFYDAFYQQGKRRIL